MPPIPGPPWPATALDGQGSSPAASAPSPASRPAKKACPTAQLYGPPTAVDTSPSRPSAGLMGSPVAGLVESRSGRDGAGPVAGPASAPLTRVPAHDDHLTLAEAHHRTARLIDENHRLRAENRRLRAAADDQRAKTRELAALHAEMKAVFRAQQVQLQAMAEASRNTQAQLRELNRGLLEDLDGDGGACPRAGDGAAWH